MTHTQRLLWRRTADRSVHHRPTERLPQGGLSGSAQRRYVCVYMYKYVYVYKYVYKYVCPMQVKLSTHVYVYTIHIYTYQHTLFCLLHLCTYAYPIKPPTHTHIYKKNTIKPTYYILKHLLNPHIQTRTQCGSPLWSTNTGITSAKYSYPW
jgi:hypothetical protein